MTRILIADPDPAARNALALLLARQWERAVILEAPDLETLIQELDAAAPDLLLLDWRLHGSPAPETCRLLRRAYPDLNVILLSIDPDDADLAQAAGAGFIYKGASPAEVLAVLETVCQPKRS